MRCLIVVNLFTVAEHHQALDMAGLSAYTQEAVLQTTTARYSQKNKKQGEFKS